MAALAGQAAGSIGGGLIGGIGRKKAARQQRKDLEGIASGYEGDIARGDGASGLISQLLGLTPGTGGAEGLARFRENSGYQDQLNTSLRGVASNAAAGGLLNSSGAGRAFQQQAGRQADASYNNFLSLLTGQQNFGGAARDKRATVLGGRPQTAGTLIGALGTGIQSLGGRK